MRNLKNDLPEEAYIQMGIFYNRDLQFKVVHLVDCHGGLANTECSPVSNTCHLNVAINLDRNRSLYGGDKDVCQCCIRLLSSFQLLSCSISF